MPTCRCAPLASGPPPSGPGGGPRACPWTRRRTGRWSPWASRSAGPWACRSVADPADGGVQPRAVTIRAVLQAVAVSVLGVLPAFLTGALAVQIRADLDVGLGMFGFAAATLFGVSGLCARPGGRLVQRLGARKGTALAAVLSILSLTAVGLAQSPVWLMAGLAIGGLGNGVAQPSANPGSAALVSQHRPGAAVGLRQ